MKGSVPATLLQYIQQRCKTEALWVNAQLTLPREAASAHKTQTDSFFFKGLYLHNKNCMIQLTRQTTKNKEEVNMEELRNQGPIKHQQAFKTEAELKVSEYFRQKLLAHVVTDVCVIL